MGMCTNIHADTHCCNALAISSIEFSEFRVAKNKAFNKRCKILNMSFCLTSVSDGMLVAYVIAQPLQCAVGHRRKEFS